MKTGSKLEAYICEAEILITTTEPAADSVRPWTEKPGDMVNY